MLQNYLAAALRNLARNRLYAAINVAGLAVGFAAALLIVLFVRDELTFDRFIPGADRIYNLQTVFEVAGRKPQAVDMAPGDLAAALRLDYPKLGIVTQLLPAAETLRGGDVESTEKVYWADANVFSVLPLHGLAGDLAQALQRPDSVVLTRSMARKYFGTETPIGQTLDVLGRDHPPHPMLVTAVLEDLPSNTNLNANIFASSATSISGMVRADIPTPDFYCNVHILIRAASATSIEQLRRELATFASRHKANAHSERAQLELRSLTALHLLPTDSGSFKRPGDRTIVYSIAAVGALILLVASINFVNLITARASRRAAEVGVRKVCGARRRDLMAQFMGASSPNAHAGTVRQLLAVAQFAVLIGLLIVTGVIYRQTSFALQHAMRLNKDEVLVVKTPWRAEHRKVESFAGALRALPGVEGAVMSDPLAMSPGQVQHAAILPSGERVPMYNSSVDVGFFEFYGVPLLAGRLFSSDRGTDAASEDATAVWHPPLVINESAVRRMGFAAPAAAVGQYVTTVDAHVGPVAPSEIIGVVPDFTFKSIRHPVEPSVYYVDRAQNRMISVRLKRGDVARTLTSVDKLGQRLFAEPAALPRTFLDEYLQALYLDVTRQNVLFAALAAVAVALCRVGRRGRGHRNTHRGQPCAGGSACSAHFRSPIPVASVL